MKKIFSTLLILSALATPVTSGFAQDNEAPPAIGEKQLLDYLENIGAWQRSILAVEISPGNSLENLLKGGLQDNAAKVMQYGFEFARAEAITLSNAPEATTVEDPTTSQAQIKKAIADISLRIDQIKTEQGNLDTRIRRTKAKLRTPLLIQREKLDGELKIANARLDLLQSVTTLFDDKGMKNSNTTVDKINNLALTLPIINNDAKKDAAKPQSKPTTNILPIAIPTATGDDKAVQSRSHGILSITSDIFGQYRKKKEIDGLLAETNGLRDNNQELITALRTTIQDAVKRANEMTNALNSADKETIADQRNKIDQFVASFKQMSTAVLPLAQINTWLDAAKQNVKDWRDLLDEQMTQLVRHLFWQVTILGVAILIPIMIAEAVRRAILNYVHDSKRQRQLNIARKSVLAFVIVLIILLNFVSEFESLATFAGFLTAGIAVALQNIILSAVAHFFYFGRFGVRVGDRVTIKGFTGEVVQVGIVRLYLMELGGPDVELYPTGKIVVFPNSILFQNEAFVKQISGADYSWQEITFLLDPSSDYQLANKKLNEAVNIVYAQYHDVMENQKLAMTRSTHLDVSMPAPKGFLNFTDAGLALIIRYPIQNDHVAEINQRITNQLLEAIGKEPSLKLLSSNPPKIVSVDHE